MPIVVDFADAAYELLDGEAEIWPGLRARQLERAGHPHPGSYHAWLERLEAFEPRRVLLAHDVVIWQRGAPYSPPSVPSVASR